MLEDLQDPNRGLKAADKMLYDWGRKQAKGKAGCGISGRTAEMLAPLAWTDGRLCIVIPRSSAELAHEGRVLRHCVGTYSKSHVSGSPIFFVRHYRRPERPYYTLNIGFTTGEPQRLQLHGYGNERHGPAKEYAHSIPRKVLDFCSRWEREILAPFWANKQRNEVTA